MDFVRRLLLRCLHSLYGFAQTVCLPQGQCDGRNLGQSVLPVLIVAAFAFPIASGAALSVPPSGGDDRIIISGAAGHLGELTVKDLLARGVPASRLILVTRTPDKLAEYAKMGASVRYGDFTDPSSLPAAFAGGNRMLLISIDFGKMPRLQAHKNAIDAAIADGVKHIVYTSWIALSGGDPTGLGADHYATEKILEQSGVQWTFLRNSGYMEQWLPVAKAMAATGHWNSPPADPHFGLVARADCAAAAAAVLSSSGHDRKIYDITGSSLVGLRELAAAVSHLTGRQIIIDSAAGAAPKAPGPSANALSALSVVSNDVKKLTGRSPMTLAAFLEEHRAELVRANH